MNYQVLARKWRPRFFDEMVGQEHVLRALINSLNNQQLHHAYLFTGTRGVGKTTIARILAKCLNCEEGISARPCGECGSCKEISEGRFVDLIEVDAASRTRVEDTRELLENVQYAPTRGRYKVYLIDEVHMLSTHSFNALLKTLEEPPPHVKFLLATTDPQKLPVTILSRCLQFNLKNMSPELIVGHLQTVLEKELIPSEEAALWQLGRAADGSMRDALSLTDQAIAFGSGKITAADVSSMLGAVDSAAIYTLIEALADGDAQAALTTVAQLAEQAPDYAKALADILSILHRIAIGQALPEAVDNSQGDREQILALAQRLASEDVQLFYQTALLGRRDLPLVPDPRAGLEMVLLRMLAFRPQGVSDIPVRQLRTSPPTPAPATPSERKPLAGKEPSADREPSPPAQPVEPVDNLSAEQGEKPFEAEPQNAASAVDPEPPAPQTPPPTPPTPAVARPVATEDSPPWEAPAESASVDEKIVPVEADSSRAVAAAPQVVEKISLEATTPESWSQVYLGLKLAGVIQNTASNCELTRREDSQFFFRLDDAASSLYDDNHQQRLADVLREYYSRPVTVQIEVGKIATHTPAGLARAQREKRLTEAVTAVKSDPLVQQLVEHFDAVIDEDSIEPIG